MGAAKRKRRSRRKTARKRSTTDTLRGVYEVRLRDGSIRYRASIPGGRRGKLKWTALVETAEKASDMRARILKKLDALPALTMTFEQAIEATRTDYAKRCRPAMLKWFDYQLPALRGFFGKMLVSTIRQQDVERFAAQQIGTGVSAGTVLHRRRGLRCVLSHAKEQLVNGDPLAKCGKGIWPRARKGKVTAPEPETIRDFLRKTIESGSPRARQDHDIVAALYLTGLRRSELARLRAEDLRRDTGKIWVQGKCDDEWLSVNSEAMVILERMAERVDRKGELVPGGAEEITRVLKTRSDRNKIDLSPHALRRAFVTSLVRAGHDVATIKRYSRHSTDEVERYMAANEDDRRVLAAVSIENVKAPKKRGAHLRKVR